MVHITLLFSSIIASLRKNKKIWLWLAFAILIIFAVLRYDFGNDYFSYYKRYSEIKAGNAKFVNEPMFSILANIFPNYFILIAITSLFTIIPVYYLIKNYVADDYKGLAVLIYCINPYLFLMSLSAIRQMLALSFFIIAIHFSKERKIIPYLIFIALATTCHISAIVLLPFYLIANSKKVNKVQVIAIVITLLILLLSNNIFDELIQYALDSFDNLNYNYYVTRGGNTVRATLLSAVWLAYFLMNISRLNGSTLMFAKLSTIGYIFSILEYRISILSRITMYFEIFSIISIPMIMYTNNTLSKNSGKLFYLANKYIFPILIFTIYILRYYSFFTNPLWEPFREYHTIISVM